MPDSLTILQQRIKKLSAVSESGCWLWTGATKPNGYGNMGWNGKTIMAHRAAWLAFHGPIPEGMNVCHHCDTPACVNPGHLFLGSQRENIADMDAKGRRVSADNSGAANPMHGKRHSASTRARQSAAKQGMFTGSQHPKATITEDIARAVKQAKGHMTAKAAAALFGVSWHVVRNIWGGKSWGCING